jgi:PAS domain S-box-containing protein
MGVTPIDKEIEIRNIDIIVSRGDGEGNITYANPIFFKISGYTQSELIDKSHNIIRHPDMPKVMFKILWDKLKAGKSVKVFVKNLSKDGSFYWVFADVKVATNPDGSFRNFVSTRKTMSKNARDIIEPLYANLIKIENSDGMIASQKALEEFLANSGDNLDSISNAMINIQNK